MDRNSTSYNQHFNQNNHANSRLLKGYLFDQLLENPNHPAFNECENRKWASTWIINKQMPVTSPLFRRDSAANRNVIKRPVRTDSSSFLLRPTRIEGTCPQPKRESSGFRGFFPRNTNYLTNANRRRKVAMIFDQRQERSPDFELTFRQQWFQKECEDARSDESQTSLPLLDAELKKVYGIPRYVTSCPRSRRKGVCNFQPVVFGLHNQPEKPFPPGSPTSSEPAQGDSYLTGKSLPKWKRVRYFSHRSADAVGVDEKKMSDLSAQQRTAAENYRLYKELSDNALIKRQGNACNFYGKTTLGDVLFGPIVKGMNIHPQASKVVSTKKSLSQSSIESRTSSTSLRSYASSSKTKPCASELEQANTCSYSAALDSYCESSVGEPNNLVIPATSLGPVKSKMADKDSKEAVKGSSQYIVNQWASTEETLENSQKVLSSSHRTSLSEKETVKVKVTDDKNDIDSGLPTNKPKPNFAQRFGFKMLSGYGHQDADDEASELLNSSKTSCKLEKESVSPKKGVEDGNGTVASNKRRQRLLLREKKRLEELDIQASSSQILNETEERKRPRKKRKRRQSADGRSHKSTSVGSEGDDEYEEDDEISRRSVNL